MCKVIKNGYTGYFTYIENEAALNDLSVLWLRDSFGKAISPLFHKTFKRTWSFNHGKVYGSRLRKFIEINKPDLVIYEVVERLLENNHLAVYMKQTEKSSHIDSPNSLYKELVALKK